MVISAGAVVSKIPAVRKLGFAIQELIRMEIPRICDKDNSKTRSLELCQASGLELDVAFWSANTRKIEIAQSHSHVLVTTLRSPGHFQRRREVIIAPCDGDDDKSIEAKWLHWVEAESFKRLALHAMIQDSQVSYCLTTRPYVFFTELSLEIPYSLDLWQAQTAREWESIWSQKQPEISQCLPSLQSCVHNPALLKNLKGCIDVELTTIAMVQSTWSIISDYRQLDLSFKSKDQAYESEESPAIGIWHQNIHTLLDHFSTNVSGIHDSISQEAFIVRELFRMSLVVNIEDLQLFAGRNGAEEAHQVYPLLKVWYRSWKSRQAIAHAAQIIRVANTAPFGRLRNFYVVGLYHCALCMWVYGICAIGCGQASEGDRNGTLLREQIWLDSEDTAGIQRFVTTGHGDPFIRGFDERQTGGYSLFNSKGIMDMVLYGMEKTCCADLGFIPPIIENFGFLLKDLGSAAWIVGNQSLRSTLPGPP
jgi:hypothetical protein